MGRFQVQAPDGHVYEFEAPEGATDQQLDAMSREAAGYAKNYPVKVKEAPAPAPSVGRQLLDNTKNDVAGIVQGAAALPDMAATAVGKVASVVPTVLGYGLDALGYDKAGSSAHRIAHGLANPFQIGDAVEAVAPTPDTTSGKVNRFIGNMVGGAVGFPGSAAENVVAKIAGEVPKGFVSPTATAAKVASPSIVGDAKEAGVRVMTSDAKPPRTFMGKGAQAFGERIPLAGTGGPRVAQQVERVQAVKNLASDYGADSAAPIADDVAADFAKTRGARVSALAKQKSAVIDSLPGAVPADQTIQAIDRQIAYLQGINADAYAPVISKLDQFKATLASGKTLQQIEGNRKLLGDMFKDPNLASIAGDGQKALNAIYGPLRSDMAAFIERTAGKDALVKWQKANDELSAMAGQLSNRAFKSVLSDAESTPENVAKLLFSQKPSDMARLYENLSPGGRAKAQAAILQRAIEKAGGLESLSPDRFSNAVKSLGKSVGVFFDGKDQARIQGLTRVLDATKRAAQASVAPPTGVQAVPYVMTAGLSTLLGFWGGLGAAGATGILARAYESVPVRNILLKLGQSKPGSAQERVLIKRAAAAMVAAAQKHGTAPGVLNDNLSVVTGAVASGGGADPDSDQQ